LTDFIQIVTLLQSCEDPSGRWLLVNDSWGRVLLIDATELTVLRCWKGYRNAQVGWLRSSEVATEPYPVLFAPKRASLEVFAGPLGTRLLHLSFAALTEVTGGDLSCALLCATDGSLVQLMVSHHPPTDNARSHPDPIFVNVSDIIQKHVIVAETSL
jgi:hypothetical protein